MLLNNWVSEDWAVTAATLLGQPARSLMIDYGEDPFFLWAYVYFNPGHRRLQQIRKQIDLPDATVTLAWVDQDKDGVPLGLELILAKDAARHWQLYSNALGLQQGWAEDLPLSSAPAIQ